MGWCSNNRQPKDIEFPMKPEEKSDPPDPSAAPLRKIIRTLCILAFVVGGTFAVAWMYDRSRLPVILNSAFGLYTQHNSNPAQTEIIPLRLDRMFTDRERADILRAAAEWNHVLNGYVRFDVEAVPWGGVASDGQSVPGNPRTWVIVRDAAKADMRVMQHGGAKVGLTWRLASNGGIVTLAVDPFYRIELAGVARHEFGHVLGLGHNPRSRLMSERYMLDEQRCIDQVTVEMVAALRRLPLGELNWCTARGGGMFSLQTIE